jgi:hypothetical protein
MGVTRAFPKFIIFVAGSGRTGALSASRLEWAIMSLPELPELPAWLVGRLAGVKHHVHHTLVCM